MTSNYLGINPNSIVINTYGSFISSAVFVYVGTIVAPRKQFIVSIFLALILTLIVGASTALNMTTGTNGQLAQLIYTILSVIGAGSVVYAVHQAITENHVEKDEELKDEKLLERAMVVLSDGYPTASANLFQRELLIGHAVALRLMDALEKKGVLGPGDHPLFRKVLINDPKKLQLSCSACKSTKVHKNGDVCTNCQNTIKEIQKSVNLVGFTTWPILHGELRIGYAGVVRWLNYMVKKKILLPPDENGKYYIESGKSDKNL